MSKRTAVIVDEDRESAVLLSRVRPHRACALDSPAHALRAGADDDPGNPDDLVCAGGERALHELAPGEPVRVAPPVDDLGAGRSPATLPLNHHAEYLCRVPPLRDRRQDIPLLVEHPLRGASRRAGPAVRFSSGAIARLRQLDWPGTVREL